ncbi:MAG TPA: hypothetical protein VIF09_19485 [Polyangiaceae bacterium]
MGLLAVAACGSSSSSGAGTTSHDGAPGDTSPGSDSTSGNDSTAHDGPSGAEGSAGDSTTDAPGDTTTIADSGTDGASSETGTTDADAGPTVASYLGTQPPGDVWSWTLDHGAGTFSAEDQTTGYTYSGTLSQVTGPGIVGNGFTRLGITATTDPSASGWQKQEAFAVEFPGVALLVSPPGPPAPLDAGPDNGYYSRLIVAAALGACPSAGATFNTMVIPTTGWAGQSFYLSPGQSITGPGYGTVTLATSGGGYTIGGSTSQVTLSYTDGGDWLILDAGVTSIAASTYGCDGGTLTSATSGTPTVGLTPAGVLIEDMGGHDPSVAGVLGVVQTDVPSLPALQGEFLGFIFAWQSGAQPYTIAVSCTPGTSADAGNETCQPYDSLDPVTPSTFGTDAAVQFPVYFDTTSTTTGVFDNHITNFNANPGLYSQNVSMITQIGGKSVLVGITGSGSMPSLQDMMLIQQ